MLFLALTISLSAGSLAAQTAGTGTISGTITDPSGAAIAAANVEVRKTNTAIDVRTVAKTTRVFTTPRS